MSSFDETMGSALSYDDDREESEEQAHRHTQFLDLTNGEGGDQMNFYDDEDDDDDGGGEGEPEDEEEKSASNTAAKTAASGVGPNTPGKVVDTGQEHTGRWTREEHAAFLSALKTHGKEWKKVAAKVKTRTVVQTRTHAQKYFQKLQKALSSNEQSKGVTVEMGVDAKQKALALKRKHEQQQQQIKPPAMVRSQSTASTHAAAHLMTNLASGSGGGGVSYAPNAPLFASAPYSSAQITAPSFATHGFSSANNNHNDQPLLPPQSLPSYPGGFFGRSSGHGGSMSIVAPEHDIASRVGKFPEPSPAATGKRKLAEIAAAQMLAGVMGGKDSTCGDTTPPPPEGLPDLAQKKTGLAWGLSLQIVNPESLGVTYEESSKRKRGPGGSSPTTPWDGDVDALVRYVRLTP